LGLATRSELSTSYGTAAIRLSGPTLPLAVSSAVWFSRKKLRWSRLSVQSNPLFEFRLPIEYYPVKPSQPAAAGSAPLMGFGSLQHIRGRRSTCREPLRSLRSAFRVSTLLTVYALRSRAGFVSHRRRSWDLPFGAFSSRKVSGALPPGWTHLPFRLSVLPSREALGRPK